MTRFGLPVAAVLTLATSVATQSKVKVATYIGAADVEATIAAAPEGRVSDQQIRYVDAGLIGSSISWPNRELSSNRRNLAEEEEGVTSRLG